MSWKDFLYFQKGDKLAVILLLVLIALSSTAYILTKRPTTATPPMAINPNQQPKAIELGHSEENDIAHDESSAQNPKAYSYPYQEKLKKGETIDINKADTSELKKIPGIGTSYSKRIVKYGKLLGGYANKAQLKEVYGMDDELYTKIAPYISIRTKPTQLMINSAEAKQLSKHPYISYKQTKVIERIRKQQGSIKSLDDLRVYDEFTDEDINRLKGYIVFD